MGYFTSLFYPWGLLLQAAAILHFIKRRPDTYWIYIVLFLGPIGAAVYLVVEALPDVTLPFWAWLLGQPLGAVNGRRYRAQDESWEVNG